MRELFVYYRVRPGAETPARSAVAAMQTELRAQHPGLVARWLTRHGASGGATWMETYATSPASGSTGIDAALESEIAALALQLTPFIDGARHVEVFDSED